MITLAAVGGIYYFQSSEEALIANWHFNWYLAWCLFVWLPFVAVPLVFIPYILLSWRDIDAVNRIAKAIRLLKGN